MQDKCCYIYLFIIFFDNAGNNSDCCQLIDRLTTYVWYILSREEQSQPHRATWRCPDPDKSFMIKMIEMLPLQKWQHFVSLEILKFHEILQNLSSGKLLVKVIFWNDFIWNLGMELHRRSYNNLNINRFNMINSMGNRKYTIFILYFFNSL